MSITRTELASCDQEAGMKQVHERNGTVELSVVLPVYQERDAIRATIMQLVQVLKETGLTFEVIAVDDGSTDGTSEIMQALSTEFPEYVRIIAHPYNKGNGAAVKTGIRAARGQMIVCMDADGQHDPSQIPALVSYLSDYDLVVGARTRAYMGSWHRNLANWIYNQLASYMTGLRIEDLTSGFRAFRASCVREFVHLFPNGFSYPTTSTLAFARVGYSIKYVPVHVNRRVGKSKIKLIEDGLRFLLIIFKTVVLFSPLRVFVPASIVCFLLGLVSFAIAIADVGRLRLPNSAVVLFVTSLMVFLLGLVSEQIAALRIELRERDHEPG